MASLHLCNTVLELLKSIYVCHGCWWRVGAFKRGLVSETRPSANHGWKREITRDHRVCFTATPQWATNVLTKIQRWCMSRWTWLKWAPRLHTSALKVSFVKRARGGTYKTRCHTLILFVGYHSWIFWFSLAELSCSTPITVQNKRSFNVLVKNAENTQGKGQKGHFRNFLGFGSPGPPNSLGVK